MSNRYWLWMAVRLLVGVAIVAWAASYAGLGSGEKEFQKTLDAMKQVHSFRAIYVANTSGIKNEMLWEVDCDRGFVHYQSHFSQPDGKMPQEFNQELLQLDGREYDRQNDGFWTKNKYAYQGNSAKYYCMNLAQGTDSNVLPQISTMIKRGVIQKGDKKKVNGVACQEWLVTMKNGTAFLDHDTVCLGLEDHLPYEMATEGNLTRYSFSDYNTSIPFDVPETAVEPTSASGAR